MADGFLGRWSQRKLAVREGRALQEPPAPVAKPAVAAAQDPVHAGSAQPPVNQTAVSQPPPVEPPPPPTLEDVKGLTTESDFAPFVARGVAPEVRNAAMKKLFTDPHYNVMDRLDIYIDDYSRPDPLPESMLRKMASAKFLKLFEEDADEPGGVRPEDEPAGSLRDVANTAADDSVAQSAQPPRASADNLLENKPLEQGIDHDHTDLRLQPNHAAGPQEPGRSTE